MLNMLLLYLKLSKMRSLTKDRLLSLGWTLRMRTEVLGTILFNLLWTGITFPN